MSIKILSIAVAGLCVHKDASIQNINLTVLTTAWQKKALKTGNTWFLRSRLLDFPTVIAVTCVAFQAKGNMWLGKFYRSTEQNVKTIHLPATHTSPQ
jgi:hypothetical protein